MATASPCHRASITTADRTSDSQRRRRSLPVMIQLSLKVEVLGGKLSTDGVWGKV